MPSEISAESEDKLGEKVETMSEEKSEAKLLEKELQCRAVAYRDVGDLQSQSVMSRECACIPTIE